ncbi:hypothetical protein ACKQTC_03400 [Peptococcus simiae]|uniref:DUF4367 domain-containing protein n=1 Tax=Peptococcus simiae TaxID=1643805 RepID=A0ABW9GZ12_9FIRM
MNTYKDQALTQLFQEAAEKQVPPADFADRLTGRLPAQERKQKARKGRRRLVTGMAAAAIFCLSVGSLYATGVFGEGGIISHSSIFADYHSLPDADTLKADLGFIPQLPEALGPFTFREASIGESTYQDKAGNKEVTVKDLIASYQDKAGTRLNLFASPALNPLAIDPEDTVMTQKGIQYQLVDYTQRVVPVNYEKTEEDLALEKAGRLNIAFGGDTITETRNAILIWQDAGIEYQLLAEDSLSSQDLLALLPA